MSLQDLHKHGRPPEGEIPPAEIGAGSAQSDDDSDDSEVGGRDLVQHGMKCYLCDKVTWITYDTEKYQAYKCFSCDAVNVL